MVHLHVGVEDLAAARVGDARADRVGDRAREPADHGHRSIFTGEIRIVRRLAGDDPLAEPSLFERRLPFLDPLGDPGLQPCRCGGVHVVRDRLLRDAEVADFLVGALQAPARDVPAWKHAQFGRAEVRLGLAEVADAGVHEARHHRCVGEADDREGVGLGRCLRHLGRCPGECGSAAAGLGRVGLRRRDVDVAGKDRPLVHERAGGVHRGAPSVGRELLHTAGEHAGHLDDRRAVLAVCLDVERREDREELDELHGALGRERGVAGDVVVVHVAYDHAVLAALKADHPIGAKRAADADAGRRAGHHGSDDEVLADFTGRNLEIQPGPDLVHAKDARLGLGARRDDGRVGTRNRIGGSPGGATGAGSTLRAGGWCRRSGRRRSNGRRGVCCRPGCRLWRGCGRRGMLAPADRQDSGGDGESDEAHKEGLKIMEGRAAQADAVYRAKCRWGSQSAPAVRRAHTARLSLRLSAARPRRTVC